MTKTGHALLFYQGKFKMNRGKTVNIRKNIDYSEMYEALDILMQKNLSQMKLYCEIGKAVCRRTEKGAAVMASEYLNEKYPDVKGFSPRSLRRMRDFYRTYENHPTLLSQALKLGWIQNVVIMEAALTMDLREWYLKAAMHFDWSKSELISNIAANAHDNIVLDIEEKASCSCKNEKKTSNPKESLCAVIFVVYTKYFRRILIQWVISREEKRQWCNILVELSVEKRIAVMRC